MKHCYSCDTEKAHSEFYMGSRGKLIGKCRACTTTAATASRLRRAAGVSLVRAPFVRMQPEQLTKEQVAALLLYDRDSGAFTWKVARGRIRAGVPAGSVSKRGYLHICIQGCVFKAHRLAWFIVTGKWPEHTINHKNGAKTDNRFDNLEDITVSDNSKHAHRTGLINTDRPRNRGTWVKAPMPSPMDSESEG